MAINTTRLATRLGHLLASLNEVNTYRGTTLAARLTTLETDYASVNTSLIGDLSNQFASGVTALDTWVTYLGTLISGVIVAEVVNDKPLPNTDIASCLKEWNRQMRLASDTFNASPCTLGAVTAVGSPSSNTQWLTTAKDGTGVVQDLIVPDVYLLTISSDDQRGGTTYAEGYTITGKALDPAATNYTYPTGEGISVTKTLIDPAKDELTANADFDLWTVANVPDDWTIVSPAAAGVNVFRVADDARTGASAFALRLLSTATGAIKLRQQVTLEPNTVYGVHWKQSPVSNGSATAANCNVTLRLVDGTGSVISDDASTANSKVGSTHAVVTAGSGWNQGYTGVFITPTTLPATGVFLEIEQNCDAAGCDDHIDHVCLIKLDPLYEGGLYLEGFSGLVRAAQGDAWTQTTTLTTGTVSTYIIRGLDRFLNLKGLGIRLPTSGTPSQSDGLIV